MALITPGEVSALARQIYTNPDIVERLIAEAESLDIRRQLGDSLFLALQGAPEGAQYITLLQGGVYSYNGANYICEGVKRALAYYVYARIIKDGNIQATEYGAVIKEDADSSKAMAEERARQYSQAFAAADTLMQSCLQFINRCASMFPEYNIGRPQQNTRGGFRVLDSSRNNQRPAKGDTIIIHGEKGDKGDPGISANPSIITKDIYNRYLYDVLMTDVDYNYAKAHIAELAHTAGACTSFRRGASVGRNFDWTFNNDAEFVVRTAGVIGVAHMPGLTAEIAAKGTWQQDERTAKLLPFMLADGVNSHGVFASVHVVDKGAEMYNIPGREDLPALMLVRYILDNFSTAEEAVAYIKSATSVTMPADLLAKGQELQWFIADSTSSYVLENIGGVLDYSEHDILTNFHWHGVTRNPDGTLYGPERPEGINPTEANGLTPYATGIERYNIVVGATGAEVAEVLDRVKYSHLYENAEGIWFSELVGGELTIDAEPESFAVRLADARNAWASRNRETGRVWHSMHSCVYDLDAKTISIVTQDGDSSIDKNPTNVALIGFDLEDVINEAQGAVKYNRLQTLTESQQTQARQNIGTISTEQMTAAILVEKQRAENAEKSLANRAAYLESVSLGVGEREEMWTAISDNERALREEVDRAQSAEAELQEAITQEVRERELTHMEIYNDLGSEIDRAEAAEADLRNEILEENTRAVDAEFELSKRIDAIVQGRNVRDIVPNYQALLDYDTTTLGDNDIIMVLLDNTKSDHTTYYRWHATDQTWEFIGGLAFTYTKTEIDQKFADLHIVLPTFGAESSQEVLEQVDETIRHAGADAQFKIAIPVDDLQGNVTVTYVKTNPMHTYLGVFADDRSELYHIKRTTSLPRVYTCEVVTKVFATADALASLIKDLYNADPAEGEEKGDIVKLREGLESLAEKVEEIAGSIQDAPEDGEIYGRQNGSWVKIELDPAISRKPHVGDIAILHNGEKMFLTPLASQEMVDNAVKIGVVYDVEETTDGTIVRVVGDGNTNSKQWSCVADYEITAVPTTSGDYAVTLNNVAQGEFSFTPDGTIKSFCEQLNAWLRSQSSTSKAAKWEAYWDEVKGKGFLQMFKYDEYESTVTIAGASLTKLIGSELASYTSSAIYNTIGQSAIYTGMSRNRLEEYCKTNISANCNPTTAMNGTTQLFVTFPCSEAYYLSDLGVNLRAHYTTYGAYLDACMISLTDTRGIMGFPDGKLMTSLLLNKVVKKDGVPTKAYTAAVYADEYTKGVSGFGHGTWWLPSMWELYRLMKDIRVDQTDAINMALGKCRYTKIAPTSNRSNRWSCCRCNAVSAWYFLSSGISNGSDFYYSFTVSVVSAFKIIKN